MEKRCDKSRINVILHVYHLLMINVIKPRGLCDVKPIAASSEAGYTWFTQNALNVIEQYLVGLP